MNDLDEDGGAVELEQGQSFGLSKRVYHCLAQLGVSASEIAGIEPQLLEGFTDKAGCVCTLFGTRYAYEIRICADRAGFPPLVALLKGDPDGPCCSLTGVGGNAENYDTWRTILREMLASEGIGPDQLWARGYFPV
jgi:hypothetical protein